MKRLNWLDTSRGIAILFLILVHYVGGLESRGFISSEVLDLSKAFLRVATPYFILIFGFTFATCYYKKLNSYDDLKKLYKKLLPKLVLVFLAREVIVLSTAIRYPEMQSTVKDILLYKGFSTSGEILSFYFLAISLAPLSLILLKNIKTRTFLFLAILIYAIGYCIGDRYSNEIYDMWFRFLFFDVYAFFPFFGLVMLGMVFSRLYVKLDSQALRLKSFGLISVLSIIIALFTLNIMSDNPIYLLATAQLKRPPHFSYMLLYTGMAVFITILVAVMSNFNFIKNYIFTYIDVIGRNSLLAYVLHYYLFLSSPLTEFLFDEKKPIVELIFFILMISLMLITIYLRDLMKRAK